jgi:outer membrane protein assembly factor BamB
MAKNREVLYVGTGRTVLALHPKTGEEVWRTTLPHGGSQVVTLLLKEGSLYVGHAGRAYRLDAQSGEILWHNGLPRTGWGSVLLTMEGAHGCTAPGVAAADAEARARAAAGATAATHA